MLAPTFKTLVELLQRNLVVEIIINFRVCLGLIYPRIKDELSIIWTARNSVETRRCGFAFPIHCLFIGSVGACPLCGFGVCGDLSLNRFNLTDV